MTANVKTIDISSEEDRQYHYRDGSTFSVPTPIRLDIIEDDRGVTHRVISQDGRTYRPERGWVGIAWTPKTDAPAYVA